jgi:deazaflavin-dependent oxidoreductase (nitroreductase family)
MTQPPKSLHNKFLDGVRVFNKYIFNHITLTFAGSEKGPFSVLYHTGRRSGRSYRTPVLATYLDGTIIIPLSYGENVDWLRNILAAGCCEIQHKNVRILAINPVVMDAAAALAMLPEERRKLLERFKLEKYLRLQVLD